MVHNVTKIVDWAKKGYQTPKKVIINQRHNDDISLEKAIKLVRSWNYFCKINNLIVSKRIWSKKTIIWKVRHKDTGLELILVLSSRP